MNDYYTSVELGTDSVKVIVANKAGNSFHVIAAIDSISGGIKKGLIVDTKQAVTSCKKAIRKVNEMLGIKITKVIAAIPTDNCRMDIVVGSTDIADTDEVTGEDISKVIKDSLVSKIENDEELVTAMPISFKVDDIDNIKDPKGMKGEELGVKVLITVSPKDIVYKILEVLKLSGLETVDIAYKPTGDYFEVSNSDMDKSVSAIVNIGEDSTNISVFNKGIMIKNKIIPVGSVNIDNDLAYIYKIDKNLARKLKEDFVIAASSYADSNEVCEVITTESEKKECNQLELSKVVESRCIDILEIARNELKNLTKREISYIIVTGGVSELAGFGYLIEDVLGFNAKVANINSMGVRHNRYSTTLGLIKYFDSKLELRGKVIRMISNEDITSLITIKENKDNNENIINRFFGRFFEN